MSGFPAVWYLTVVVTAHMRLWLTKLGITLEFDVNSKQYDLPATSTVETSTYDTYDRYPPPVDFLIIPPSSVCFWVEHRHRQILKGSEIRRIGHFWGITVEHHEQSQKTMRLFPDNDRRHLARCSFIAGTKFSKRELIPGTGIKGTNFSMATYTLNDDPIKFRNEGNGLDIDYVWLHSGQHPLSSSEVETNITAGLKEEPGEYSVTHR
ncbi:hypothetical protein F5146DRAFT_1202330 [Armillaria mellea]|nr:hypothetical protein F5146DRAFT_1202330 [Armillaria mellea]